MEPITIVLAIAGALAGFGANSVLNQEKRLGRQKSRPKKS
jgi:hypothetical protein